MPEIGSAQRIFELFICFLKRVTFRRVYLVNYGNLIAKFFVVCTIWREINGYDNLSTDFFNIEMVTIKNFGHFSLMRSVI